MRQHAARENRLRAAGVRLTRARLAVLAALESQEGHLTSAELLRLTPGIGRASVFRALELFTRLGIVRPTHIHSGAPSYVLLPDGHHHHIICNDCERVIEFEDCRLGPLQAELEERLGVQLGGHLLEFYGRCARCAQATATP